MSFEWSFFSNTFAQTTPTLGFLRRILKTINSVTFRWNISPISIFRWWNFRINGKDWKYHVHVYISTLTSKSIRTCNKEHQKQMSRFTSSFLSKTKMKWYADERWTNVRRQHRKREKKRERENIFTRYLFPPVK